MVKSSEREYGNGCFLASFTFFKASRRLFVGFLYRILALLSQTLSVNHRVYVFVLASAPSTMRKLSTRVFGVSCFLFRGNSLLKTFFVFAPIPHLSGEGMRSESIGAASCNTMFLYYFARSDFVGAKAARSVWTA